MDPSSAPLRPSSLGPSRRKDLRGSEPWAGFDTGGFAMSVEGQIGAFAIQGPRSSTVPESRGAGSIGPLTGEFAVRLLSTGEVEQSPRPGWVPRKSQRHLAKELARREEFDPPTPYERIPNADLDVHGTVHGVAHRIEQQSLIGHVRRWGRLSGDGHTENAAEGENPTSHPRSHGFLREQAGWRLLTRSGSLDEVLGREEGSHLNDRRGTCFRHSHLERGPGLFNHTKGPQGKRRGQEAADRAAPREAEARAPAPMAPRE